MNKPNDSSTEGNGESPPNNTDTDASNSAGGSSLSELKVHYIDVGQADATLLQFSYKGEDFTILIDARKWNRNDVVNYLNSQGKSQIDIAIGTHPDSASILTE